MSAAAAWSYTATATLWVLQSAAAWSGAPTFAAPVTFRCDYSAEAKLRRDARGDEFTTQLLVYTERAGIKAGDRILLGTSSAADPIAAGALAVRSVLRQADVFDRAADDYEVAT